ncbi:MAG: ferritin-like domain-containing protein [Pseudomonadota bacterium]|nr:ferritin-like domain-containing protein [Pseudomonadota bacterium]
MKKTPANSLSLAQAPESIFRIWNSRKTAELEAATLFARLATELFATRGPNDPVALLAEEAAADEHKHAEYCQAILEFSPKYLKPIIPRLNVELGPVTTSRTEKILYACVAMGCVTETLSTALLVAMRARAEEGLIRDTVHQILRDEVNHSRIGWAELARCAKSQDISWLSTHIPGMITAALVSDVAPMLSQNEVLTDLSRWGILAPSEAREISAKAISEVILPGLSLNGIFVSQEVPVIGLGRIC